MLHSQAVQDAPPLDEEPDLLAGVAVERRGDPRLDGVHHHHALLPGHQDLPPAALHRLKRRSVFTPHDLHADTSSSCSICEYNDMERPVSDG